MAVIALQIPDKLVISDLATQNRAGSVIVRIPRFNPAGGIDPAAILNRAPVPVAIRNRDVVLVDRHADRCAGYASSSGVAAKPRCHLCHRTRVRPVVADRRLLRYRTRRVLWRRCAVWRWRCIGRQPIGRRESRNLGAWRLACGDGDSREKRRTQDRGFGKSEHRTPSSVSSALLEWTLHGPLIISHGPNRLSWIA
jgi:hypothetical protein